MYNYGSPCILISYLSFSIFGNSGSMVQATFDILIQRKLLSIILPDWTYLLTKSCTCLQILLQSNP